MTEANPPAVFQVTLEAAPSAVPAAARLKRFLKLALRGYGLKVLTYRQLPPAGRGPASIDSEGIENPAASGGRTAGSP